MLGFSYVFISTSSECMMCSRFKSTSKSVWIPDSEQTHRYLHHSRTLFVVFASFLVFVSDSLVYTFISSLRLSQCLFYMCVLWWISVSARLNLATRPHSMTRCFLFSPKPISVFTKPSSSGLAIPHHAASAQPVLQSRTKTFFVMKIALGRGNKHGSGRKRGAMWNIEKGE